MICSASLPIPTPTCPRRVVDSVTQIKLRYIWSWQVMLEIMIHNMVGTVDILIDAMVDEINLFCGVKEKRAYVRPLI